MMGAGAMSSDSDRTRRTPKKGQDKRVPRPSAYGANGRASAESSGASGLFSFLAGTRGTPKKDWDPAPSENFSFRVARATSDASGSGRRSRATSAWRVPAAGLATHLAGI